MNTVVIVLAFFSTILVGALAIKNGLESFADEIKTEIAILETKNNNDIQKIAKRLDNVDIRGVEKSHVKIYIDDSFSKKAEKIYEVCETNDELLKVLLHLDEIVKETENEQSVHEL